MMSDANFEARFQQIVRDAIRDSQRRTVTFALVGLVVLLAGGLFLGRMVARQQISAVNLTAGAKVDRLHEVILQLKAAHSKQMADEHQALLERAAVAQREGAAALADSADQLRAGQLALARLQDNLAQAGRAEDATSPQQLTAMDVAIEQAIEQMARRREFLERLAARHQANERQLRGIASIDGSLHDALSSDNLLAESYLRENQPDAWPTREFVPEAASDEAIADHPEARLRLATDPVSGEQDGLLNPQPALYRPLVPPALPLDPANRPADESVPERASPQTEPLRVSYLYFCPEPSMPSLRTADTPGLSTKR